jgi:hypothetical protein
MIQNGSWPGDFAVGEIDEEEYHRRLEALRLQQYASTADRG